ncbi:MAG: ATP-binding cassette domain-containing protein [Acidimicrobiales bacterium]|nr:ATP-binding cassette domain-containing protein [Acidimicrobiales bacterium]MCB9393628.1 ATP-binding cassette domain-containing protein [Acidimicrobiaceae bacterium]
MSTSSPTPAIVADGLVMHFGDVHALQGVSFDVPSGSVLGLLGPNGAGKTTAVRILTTILRPTRGRAEVAGIDVVAHPNDVRRRIGLAGQYAAVDENLTGRENLTLVGRLNHLATGDARRRAAELLEQFHLSDAANRPVRTYSGGMRRRLDLAAALVTHPPVLLLDEPTTGLDPASRQDLWDVIGTLVSDGTTVLLTTQYLEEADRLADRIVVIDHGLVVAEGTAAQLKSRLGETTVVLSFHDPAAAADAVGALVDFGASRPVGEQVVVHLPLRGGAGTVRDALNLLHDRSIDVGRIDLHEPTLDDVFISLTGSSAS